MTKILALDASTEACSVALTNDQKIFMRHQIAPRKHCDLILPMVDELLKEQALSLNQLDAFAVSIGPGAFTGVRISLSVVQGLAYSIEKPVIPISTLEVLAYGAFLKKFAESDGDPAHSCEVAVAIDARMDEVYWGHFRVSANSITALASAGVFVPEKIPLANIRIKDSCLLAGTGWEVYSERLGRRFNLNNSIKPIVVLPQADWLLKIALSRQDRAIHPKDIQPLYLRDKVAATIKERLSQK